MSTVAEQLLIGRPVLGLIGDDRKIHVFRHPGRNPWNVYTLCGKRYWSGDIEWMDIPIPSQYCPDCVVTKVDESP